MDTQIRGKAVGFVLFAAMIFLSIYFQRQQAQTDAEQAAAGQVAAEQQAESGAGQQLGSDAGQQAGSDAGQQLGSDARQQAGNSVGQQADMEKKIALTFDDGPHPVYTKLLLDGLRERGVKATFFVVGENIPGREDIIRQMAQDGHLIGNHTYDHCDISSLSAEEACRELKKTSDLVEQITGNATAYVRPPFGKWDDALDCRTSMIAVKWTVDPMDWTTKNTSQVVAKVLEAAAENDIILLHDYYESSVKAALEIVDRLQAEGFTFVTVEELLLE